MSSAVIGRTVTPGAVALWRTAQGLALAATVALIGALFVTPDVALRLLWDVAIPVLPAVFLLDPALWRNVCPLGTLNLLPNRLGGRRPLDERLIPAAGSIGTLSESWGQSHGSSSCATRTHMSSCSTFTEPLKRAARGLPASGWISGEGDRTSLTSRKRCRMRSVSGPAAAGVLIAIMAACSEDPSGPRPPQLDVHDVGALAGHHTVAVFYVIPSDVDFEQNVLDRLIQATRDAQAWYQCATGGLTWELAFHEVVRVYSGDMTRQEYVDGGVWGPVLTELGNKGLPIWSPGTVTALWVRGPGFWAGAAPGCDGECGVALLGAELFRDFNNPAWSGGICPAGEGVSAFPCTPVGAFAHELGHALAALPHPLDVVETRDVASHSIMQTHWNYPTFAPAQERPWGFLTVDRTALRSSPFLKEDVELSQPHDCDVVNLPVTGDPPRTRLHLKARQLTLSLTNQSKRATLFYWTFGDGSVSNSGERRLAHTYAEPGSYTVTLRASSDESMIGLMSRVIEVPRSRGSVALAPGNGKQILPLHE